MFQCSRCSEFTLNMMSEWFLESANHTCGNYDRGVNEIELAGLTTQPSMKVPAQMAHVWAAVTALRLDILLTCSVTVLHRTGSSLS